MTTDKKINVLEVIQQGEIGGGESHLLTLLGQLNHRRFEPVVVALSDGEMITRLKKSGIKNYVVKTKRPFNVMVWNSLEEILKENNIDIVHTHGARALSNLIYPSSRLAIPIVHTVHGWSFHDYLPAWKRKLRIKGEKFLTGKSTVNIAVSESNRKIGLQQFGSFNCEVINNGVDLSIYHEINDGRIREEFQIPQAEVLISFVARFINDKNPLPLIRAFKNISEAFPLTSLIMVGNGPALEKAKSLALELNVANRVFFPGFRNDIRDILAASDIFCLPSIKEGLPVSLIEAMAMKNAVITTNVQGCIDVVSDNKDGLWVPLENLEEGLTAALGTLLGDPAKRMQLAVAARKTVEERFNAEQMARKIENVYETLFQSNPRSISK